MTKSRRSDKNRPPESLIEFLNCCFDERVWDIRGWNERAADRFKVSIDWDSGSVQTDSSSRMPKLALTHMAWGAGLIPAKNEDELNSIIDGALEESGNRTVALALDTNLVYSRFYPNFIMRYHGDPYESKPHFVLLCQGTYHELHYKLSYRIRNRDLIDSLCKFYENDHRPYWLLTRRRSMRGEEEGKRILRRVPEYNGRLGIKGLREVKRLQENYPVIMSKPNHIYYSEAIQAQSRFMDAVFDSLIRYEAAFLRNNTNTRVLFLTSDKHQYQSADSEGMEALYVEPPTSYAALSTINRNSLRIGNMMRLIEELLVFSPCIELRIGDNTTYLTSGWEGMGPQDARDGIIRGIWNDQEIQLTTD